MNTLPHYTWPYLRQLVYHVEEKYVALTFDDGPSPHTTPKILEILQEEKIPATFFMVGKQVQTFPKVAEKVHALGYEIGNHSYSHGVITKQGHMKEELEKTGTILKQLGVTPLWFRPPYGLANKELKKISQDLGMQMVLWTVDSQDWHTRSSEEILHNIKKDLKPGAIILMHDTKLSTVSALKTVIQELKKKGYTFVSLSQWQKKIQGNS
jgi:peptidoglycan/xylan/chitin deacetylase (PgdA/CDA1 family)